jgi:hypothetical protein
MRTRLLLLVLLSLGACGGNVGTSQDEPRAEASTCARTRDGVAIVDLHTDGVQYGCPSGLTSGPLVFAGGLVELARGSFSVQMGGSVARLSVAAPELDLTRVLTAMGQVEVKLEVLIDGDRCASRVMVRSGGIVRLLASDGALATFDEAPFRVDTSPLGCGVDAYALRFSSSEGEATVRMGGAADFIAGKETLRAKNLRAFEREFAYWVAAVTP